MKQSAKTILILGGDGYLGWSLGLAFAKRTEYRVVLVDSLIKRDWEKEVEAKLLVPFKQPQERIEDYRKIFKKDNLTFERICLLDKKSVVDLIERYRPFLIINSAQQPSAPFSMMSVKNAAATFSNNILGHLNVLWAIAETDKDINYIKLGSAGCYMGIDTDYLPLHKIDLEFKYGGYNHQVLDSWLPMCATDFYHQSKIFDFHISDLCASAWNLKTVTVQQATIFGATIPENRPVENHDLATRFNYDSVFSTVMNRFVCELAIGHPLTVYGDGSQKTGLISLSDTVDNFIKISELEIKPGEHKLIHNFSFRLTVGEIAETLAEVDKNGVSYDNNSLLAERYGLELPVSASGEQISVALPVVAEDMENCQKSYHAKIQYLDNPRLEPKGKLAREVEIHSVIKNENEDGRQKLKEELSDFLSFVKLYKDNIDTSIIMPKVKWQK